MLTPFMIGWILASNIPFERLCEFHLDEFGGMEYFPEIALGVASHNCENQWEFDETAGMLLADERESYEVVDAE